MLSALPASSDNSALSSFFSHFRAYQLNGRLHTATSQASSFDV
jgi:hypothetical protein